ncbi:hypothetical protein PAESOLCIP111_05803 [Paenibacillus solanacearum]|uniref:Uncharacterized protein n=1 Tax=Paenibacillus solanacearum TaxID=2048548 RepID=A0A916NLA6_9BACL|nr:DUF11 domain-containing protein [Paenibacillus solanacearum]CAG7649151.1 hypothetical protein PAESOLCIP111_05803 [Paenibacillus solanacearum]
MMNQWVMRCARAALLVALSIGPVLPPNAATAAGVFSAGSLADGDGSLFELGDVMLLPSQAGHVVTFTLTVTNNGSSDLSLDYWMRLRTASGIAYNVALLPSGQGGNQAAPHASKRYTYYAKVDGEVNVKDLALEFYALDFSQPGYERRIGQISVPPDYAAVTPAGEAAEVRIGGTRFQAKINRFARSKSEKAYSPFITLEIKNHGNTLLPMPQCEYFIRTPEGRMYPLETKNGKSGGINPNESGTLQLTGSVPSSVPPDGWELLMAQPVPEQDFSMLVGDLRLPSVVSNDNGKLGQEYSFVGKSGVYTAQLVGINRLPWEDQDVLSATVKLSNQGNELLPLPELDAYFVLDQSIKIDARLMQRDQVISLDAGGEVSVQIIGKIPYAFHYGQIKLVLQEKESDSLTNDVLELWAPSDPSAIPSVGAGSTYMRDTIGHRSRYAVHSVNTYKGASGDLFSAEFEVDNLEKRAVELPPFAARFLAGDGSVFPAQVSRIPGSLAPNGKARYHVWSMLPKGFPVDRMQLIVGEVVASIGDEPQTENPPYAYMNAVSFALPAENHEVNPSLKQIGLFPYVLSLGNIGTSINSGKLYLKFDYELAKISQAASNTEGHKLVLAFEDSTGNLSFEKKYPLSEMEPRTGNQQPEAGDNTLKLGTKRSFTITVDEEELIFKAQFLEQYRLSIYDEFQGQRKLLAEQSLDWFTVTK